MHKDEVIEIVIDGVSYVGKYSGPRDSEIFPGMFRVKDVCLLQIVPPKNNKEQPKISVGKISQSKAFRHFMDVNWQQVSTVKYPNKNGQAYKTYIQEVSGLIIA